MLIQEYRNKQQKQRQNSPLHTGSSPLNQPSHSPLHTTGSLNPSQSPMNIGEYIVPFPYKKKFTNNTKNTL